MSKPLSDVPDITGALSFDRWLAAAKPGDRCRYYRGFLSAQVGKKHPLRARVLEAAAAGQVHPVQRRLGAGDFEYLAVRAPRGAHP